MDDHLNQADRRDLKAEETDRRSDAETATPDFDDVKDFESAIKELETIVDRLEEGDLPLEESLRRYERGVHLSRYCQGRLEDAERRIEILTKRGERRPAPEHLAEAWETHREERRPATATTSDRDGAGPPELNEDDIPF